MKIRISLIGWYLILFAFIALSLICLTGCKTQYVPIKEVHTEYIHSTDTVHKIDTVTNEKETVIREVNDGDSALLAQYGIRLKDNERMILFLQRELEREKSQQTESRHDTVIQRDTIPVPYPVEKSLSWWQQQKQDFGEIMMLLLAIAAVCIFWKHKRCLSDS